MKVGSLRVSLCLAGVAIAVTCHADDRYFGMALPNQPERFEPPIFENLGVLIPTNPAFSPDFRRFVFTAVNLETPKHTVTAIYESRYDGEQWSAPAHVASLHEEGFNNAEPVYSSDGKWLYFTSTRPPGSPPWNTKVFRARTTQSGYSAVELVDVTVTAFAPVFYPQLTETGDLLFTSGGLPGKGRDDVYVANLADSGYERPTSVAGDFNTESEEWDLIEHPNGLLRLWASGREGGAGKIDIYFARKDSRGQWSAAKNFTALNTPGVETAPKLSPDGEVLFFQRIVNKREQIFWVRLASVLPRN